MLSVNVNKKTPTPGPETFYSDQMKILWLLHHEPDEKEHVWGKGGKGR
jgi:hypothetical protein